MVPLDRCPRGRAQARRLDRRNGAVPCRAAVLVACLSASGCGENRALPPAAPRAAPARDVVVRTGRFAIHANAYVDYYAWSRQDPREGLDPDVVARLGACSDDPCARAAIDGVAGAE